MLSLGGFTHFLGQTVLMSILKEAGLAATAFLVTPVSVTVSVVR
jgi:hypothetical protein